MLASGTACSKHVHVAFRPPAGQTQLRMLDLAVPPQLTIRNFELLLQWLAVDH